MLWSRPSLFKFIFVEDSFPLKCWANSKFKVYVLYYCHVSLIHTYNLATPLQVMCSGGMDMYHFVLLNVKDLYKLLLKSLIVCALFYFFD